MQYSTAVPPPINFIDKEQAPIAYERNDAFSTPLLMKDHVGGVLVHRLESVLRCHAEAARILSE